MVLAWNCVIYAEWLVVSFCVGGDDRLAGGGVRVMLKKESADNVNNYPSFVYFVGGGEGVNLMRVVVVRPFVMFICVYLPLARPMVCLFSLCIFRESSFPTEGMFPPLNFSLPFLLAIAGGGSAATAPAQWRFSTIMPSVVTPYHVYYPSPPLLYEIRFPTLHLLITSSLSFCSLKDINTKIFT